MLASALPNINSCTGPPSHFLAWPSSFNQVPEDGFRVHLLESLITDVSFSNTTIARLSLHPWISDSGRRSRWIRSFEKSRKSLVASELLPVAYAYGYGRCCFEYIGMRSLCIISFLSAIAMWTSFHCIGACRGPQFFGKPQHPTNSP